MTELICQCDSDRRDLLVELQRSERKEKIAGIDYARTQYKPSEDNAPSCERIELFFIGQPRKNGQPDPNALSDRNFLIRHKRRNDRLTIKKVISSPPPKDCFDKDVSAKHDSDPYSVTIEVEGAETHTAYEVRIVEVIDGLQSSNPPCWLDPRFSSIDVQFYVDNDSKQTEVDPVRPDSHLTVKSGVELNYLARDYQSYLRVLFDRLAETMPQWREQRAADGFVAVLEVLAYVADRLSYFQDAVATEAYLHTARRRISVRRHARLVDYRVNEGSNARTFLHVQVRTGGGFEPDEVFFITTPPSETQLEGVAFSEEDIEETVYQQLAVFEPIRQPLTDAQRLQAALVQPEEIKNTPKLAEALLAFAPLIKRLGPCTEKPRLQKYEDALKPKNDSLPLDQLVEVACHQLSSESDVAFLVQLINDHLDYVSFQATDTKQDCRGETLRDEPLRIRNRRILDEQQPGAISRAKLDETSRLYPQHNNIEIYTWGESECHLPHGATSATLANPLLKPRPKKVCEGKPIQDASTASPCDDSASKAKEGEQQLDHLGIGDLLLFEEVKGPSTGRPEDADPTRRQIVRLTHVESAIDPVTGDGVLKVWWGVEDALRFTFCVSTRRGVPYCDQVGGVTIARGNLVAVDQGRTIYDEPLGSVAGEWRQVGCDSDWEEAQWRQERKPFQPHLQEPGLTHARGVLHDQSADAFLKERQGPTVPQIRVREIPAVTAVTPARSLPLEPATLNNAAALKQAIIAWRNDPRRRPFFYTLQDLLPPDLAGLLDSKSLDEELSPAKAGQLAARLRELTLWTPADDLIDNESDERRFVIEMDDHRRAHLRFGDGHHGYQPDAGAAFYATYRIGGGSLGNVGSEAVVAIVTRARGVGFVTQVRNPLPAVGGQEPESLDHVKLSAPHHYRDNPNRAVLARDYADLAKRDFPVEIQNATAELRWRATHWEARVAVDPFEVVDDVDSLYSRVQDRLQTYRRMGHRVKVVPGDQVALEIHARVTVQAEYARGDVRQAVMDLFSNRIQANGEPGLFHADKRTFGESVAVSRLVAAAAKIPGVENVVITKLARRDDGVNVAGVLRSPNEEAARKKSGKDPQPDSDKPKTMNGGRKNGNGEELPDLYSNELRLGPLEIARLDNTDREENGRFCLTLMGGR